MNTFEHRENRDKDKPQEIGALYLKVAALHRYNA